jgi:polyhydroxyalkanoate synthesis repressor PhaR
MAKIIDYVKYPNRRIYDTDISGYVPFSSIRKRIMEGYTIVVHDHKTKEDVTREVLINILLDNTLSGPQLFSEDLMRMIIKLYGNPVLEIVKLYFDQNLALLNSFWSNTENINNKSQ